MGGLIDLRQLWGAGLATLVRGELTQRGEKSPVGWFGITTNPVIGNGSIAHYWQRSGTYVDNYISMVAGASTTFGSGSWYFSLPFTPYAEGYEFGECWLYDSSITLRYQYRCFVYLNSISIFCPTGAASSATAIDSATPFTWAASDQLWIHIRYRI